MLMTRDHSAAHRVHCSHIAGLSCALFFYHLQIATSSKNVQPVFLCPRQYGACAPAFGMFLAEYMSTSQPYSRDGNEQNLIVFQHGR